MIQERLIHSLKTTLAVGLGFLLTRLISLPSDQWVIITILVVMCAQLYVGGVLQKSILRFAGTLAGSLYAILCLIFLGIHPLYIGLTLMFSSFCFSWIATSQENLAYAGTLGAVTVPIIVLGQHPSVLFALARCLEISLGLLIATVVSQFVLPIHARAHLKRAQTETLRQLLNYFSETQRQDITDLDHEERDEAIVKSLLKQRQLAKESSREPLGLRFNPTQFSACLFAEREILRAITFMHLARKHLPTHPIFSTEALTTFQKVVSAALAQLTKIIENPSEKTRAPLPNINELRLAFSNTHPTPDDTLYLDGYLFNAEILSDNINKLNTLFTTSLDEPDQHQ